MTEQRGLQAALAVAVDAYEPETEEQLDLLGLAETPASQALEKRGRGRPPGSRNRYTVEQAMHLLSTRGDPRAMLLQLAMMPVEDFCAKTGCKPMEAIAEKRLAAIAVLPYVAQRQPLSVDLTNKSVVYLTIQDGGDPAAPGGLTLDAHVVEILENQPLSKEPPDEV